MTKTIFLQTYGWLMDGILQTVASNIGDAHRLEDGRLTDIR